MSHIYYDGDINNEWVLSIFHDISWALIISHKTMFDQCYGYQVWTINNCVMVKNSC